MGAFGVGIFPLPFTLLFFISTKQNQTFMTITISIAVFGENLYLAISCSLITCLLNDGIWHKYFVAYM